MQTQLLPGEMLLSSSFHVTLDGPTGSRAIEARRRFFHTLGAITGITVWTAKPSSQELHVHIDQPEAALPEMGEDESYELRVDEKGSTLHAATTEGALHGLQTFLQLVRPSASGFGVPALIIRDKPRFVWRGLMLDCSRHFMPVEVIERTLDGMEAVKLNVFHWHLSDDQGFRAQILSLPQLTERGSDGLFYTQQQMREVVRYAALRGIRVVPEIDMPAHTSALLAAYPSMGSSGRLYTIERHWGIFDAALDPANEATYKTIDQIVVELAAIFPDPYFHIGGDECTGKEWKTNPAIQIFMREHRLADAATLQAYFSNRVEEIVRSHKKIAVGWDEILQPGMAQEAVIQSWHGVKALDAATKSGHQALLSKGFYLDLNLSAASHYAVDPLGSDVERLPEEQQHQVLGGEAAMWTEYVSSETVDARIWPRTAAIAERLWSQRVASSDVNDMYGRLLSIPHFLEAHGIVPDEVRMRMLHRIAGEGNVEFINELASVEEPPKQHDRARVSPTDSFTPLNRMVDAIAPESDLAREFAVLCRKATQGQLLPPENAKLHTLLFRWKNLNSPEDAANNTLLRELDEPANALRDEAALGLEALDAASRDRPLPGEWQKHAHERLAVDARPHAAMTLAITDSIASLIDAAANHSLHATP